ncbi:hypothetical protein ABPG75_000930 [Micractinium tetrahymenae]
MSGGGLSLLQQEAYYAVCRAFYAQPALGWDQEDVLTKLRDWWNISNQTHSSITQEMRNDPDVVAVRSGGMPSRLGRTKTGLGGAAAPAPSLGGSLAAGPSFRRAPSARPSGALGAPMGGSIAGLVPRSASGMVQRSRSTRQHGGYGGALDPMGYVGRRLWRLWPAENPPWVEGFVQQWDPDTDNYTIVYDPNTTAATEEVFNFTTASEAEYALGEYVDMTAVHGSQRLPDKPYIPPDVLAMPPPPGLLAALAPAPSKKRKSISGAPVPVDAPFEITYLNARLPVAGEDELQQMLSVLERKERIVEAEINILEYQEANREDIEKRAELEHKFRELCDREAQLMAEIAALREVTAAV